MSAVGVRRERAKTARAQVMDVTADLAALDDMTVGELQARWAELFGEAARSRSKAYLKKRLAWRIQELAEGGLSAKALGRIEALQHDAPVRHRPPRGWRAPGSTAAEVRPAQASAEQPEPSPEQADQPPRDPRLPPPGTVLRREHKGEVHEVVVLRDGGFEHQGVRYKSLSAIAAKVTGTRWNGFGWFGLSTPKGGAR